MKMTKKQKVCAASLMMGLTLTAPMHANAKDFLEAMFDDMWTATTDPAFVTTQSRGGLVAGSFSARIPTKPISVFAVDPPRLSAGCGGIDMIGGSFSFINGDELIAILRAIGQQAKALLFKLAIDAINKQLGGLITEFAEKVQKMNELLKNTCSIAQGAVDLFTPDSWKVGMEGKQRNFAEKWANATGSVGDAFSSSMKSFTDWNWSKKASENPAVADGKDDTMYNSVWRQAWQSNALQELTQGVNAGDNRGITTVLLMNLTGTTIAKPETGSEANCKDAGGSTIPNCSQQVVEMASRLTIDGLRNPGEMKINVCADEPVPTGDKSDWLKTVDAVTGCTSMTTAPLASVYPGTDKYVNEGLFGVSQATMSDSDYLGATGGLVGYINHGTALDARAKGMLTKSDMPMLAYLRKVQRSPEAVVYVARQIAPLAAEDEALKLMSALTRTGRQIYADGAQKAVMPGNYMQNLRDVEAELNARRGATSTRITTITALTNYVKGIVENLPAGANAFAMN